MKTYGGSGGTVKSILILFPIYCLVFREVSAIQIFQTKKKLYALFSTSYKSKNGYLKPAGWKSLQTQNNSLTVFLSEVEDLEDH